MQNYVCFTHMCFLWQEEWRPAFTLLLAAESFYLPGPVVFFSVTESPVIFQRLLCTTIFPVVLLTKHILQEWTSKRLSVVEFGCVLWCCSPCKSFINRDLIQLLKSECVSHFGCLLDFGSLDQRTGCLDIFNKLHLWVLWSIWNLTEEHPRV